MKRLKLAWAESDHIVVPFVSDTLGSMSGASTVTMCLFAGCQAVQETEFFVKDWGDGAGADTGTSVGEGVEARSPPMGCAPDVGCLASDRGEGHRPRCPCRQELGVPQERVCPFPEHLRLRSTTMGSA